MNPRPKSSKNESLETDSDTVTGTLVTSLLFSFTITSPTISPGLTRKTEKNFNFTYHKSYFLVLADLF